MFPYIEVQGTHRQIGEAIGEELRPQIKKALQIHFKRLHEREQKHQKKAIDSLTRNVRKFFPDFVDEVEGMAAGAGQKFEDFLLFSFEEELSPGEKCTSLAVKGKKTIYFAHNEDWDLGLPLYVIKAKPKKKPAFLSVAYAGQFPGTVVGFNDRGFVYAGNSVETKVNFNGMPKVYCLRKFLECSSVEDAVSFVAARPRAIGNNSLMASERDGAIATLEWSPYEYSLEETGHGLAHTNHFLLPTMHKHQSIKTSKGSYRRYLHAEEKILASKDPKLADIKKIMKAHFGENIGVCQHGQYKTLASVIVDTSQKIMFVAEGTPCDHPYKKFKFY
jgi:predicted choloylglycine hydrolase